MDGAAKKVNLVAQRVLPDRPHHLSLSPTRRYPVPNDFWQHHSRLQYSTFLSDADRGVLLTRAYYDIREEPETAALNSAHATPRTEVKKPLTKMSFKDYKNQKKTPLSPSENGTPGKVDMKSSQGLATKAGKEGIRRDEGKPRDADRSHDARLQESRKQEDSDRPRTHPSKGDSKASTGVLTEGKKRATDAEDSPRPQKRPKPENAGLPPKPEVAKAEKLGVPSQPTPNGRASSGALKESSHGSSPKPTVNGIKSQLPSSSTSTPRKSDNSSKPTVPPLLSPLRFAIDDEHEAKGPKRKPVDTAASSKSGTKLQKSDGTVSKKQKSPLKIPPLLSPTLPPIVEEALARRQLTPSKGDSSQRGSQASDSPGSAKKPRSQGERQEEKEDAGPPSKIVVLKYRKKLAKRVERLLALQPASQKEKQKRERSASVESAVPAAKKRPLTTESLSSKRVRTSDAPSYQKPLAPSTPSKTGIAMSRAASGTSQAQTPGDSTRLTPSAADRPPTSHEGSDHLNGSKVATLRQRHADFTRLGTKLKHDRDDIVRGRREGAKIDASGQVQLTTADEKRVVALTLEMVLAFMVGFKSLSQARQLERKPWDPVPWEQLQPHLQELKHRSRHARPLQSLALQLNAVCLEELCLAYANQDQALGSKAASSFIQMSRRRYDAWQAAHDILPTVKDEGMRVELGPWTAPIEAAAAALRTLRRWVERENVDWRAEIVLPIANGA